jgi:hypothetical protein
MIQISARIGEISNLSDSLSLPIALSSGKGPGLFQRGLAAVAPHQSKFLAKFQKLFRRAVGSYRAMPPLRVVVSHDDTHAVEKSYLRVGRN